MILCYVCEVEDEVDFYEEGVCCCLIKVNKRKMFFCDDN